MAGAEVTASIALAAITEVGLTMTVVGAVTGSKDLMKIGGVMSLVGGVGGFINGAVSGAAAGAEGLSEAGTNAALDTASTEAAASMGGDAAAEAAQQAGIESMGGAASDSIVSGAAQQLPAATMTTPTDEIGQALQSPTPQAAAQTPVAPDANTVATPQGATTPAGAQTPTDVATPYSNPTDMRLAAGTQSAPQSSGSFWNSFSSFADKNSKLLASGLQLVGGAMNGASQTAMWNQKMDLEKQRLAQTSFGSTAGSYTPNPNPGIVTGARA